MMGTGDAVTVPAGSLHAATATVVARPTRRRQWTELTDWPRTTRILPWLIALFVAMLYLFPFNDANLPVSLPFGLRLDRILLVLILAVWLLDSLVTPRPPRARSRWTAPQIAVLIFLIVACASILLNWQVLFALGDLSVAVKKLFLLVSYLTFLVIVAKVIRPSEIKAFTMLIVGLGALEALGAVYEYRTHVNLFYTLANDLLPGVHVSIAPALRGVDELGRWNVIGPTDHGLALTGTLTMTLPFALVMLMEAKDRRTKLLSGFASAAIFAGCVATLRKSAFVAPAAAILVLTLYYRTRMVRMLPVAVVLGAMVHVLAPGALGSVFDFLKPSTLVGVNTTKQRLTDYDAVGPYVFQRPLIGRGYETFLPPKYRFLDNAYLGLLIETGLIGLIAYLGMIATSGAAAFRLARQHSPRSPPALAAAAGIAAFGVLSELFDVLGFPEVPYLFFLLTGLVVVCLRAEPDPQRAH
jgi:hypothetical protein